MMEPLSAAFFILGEAVLAPIRAGNLNPPSKRTPAAKAETVARELPLTAAAL
jgi:hypothetical protein